MRQLTLDRRAKDIADSYEKVMMKSCSRSDSLYKKAEDALKELRKKIDSHAAFKVNVGTIKAPNWIPLNKKNLLAYIDLVLKYHKELLTVHPSGKKGFSYYISEFEKQIPRKNINKAIVADNTSIESLTKQIVKAMKYKEMRDEVYPLVTRDLGIKTCVYCNANYTITDRKGRGYYDLDHWKPKALYPYLCTSFFNLQPACPSCNRKKSDDDEKEFFQLWDDTGKHELDVMGVDLTPESVIEYLLEHDASKLEPYLFAKKPQYEKMCKDTNEKLHINIRYQEHVDVAEEVIWKARAYNASYSKAMQDAFIEEGNTTGLNLKVDELNRFILGTYTNTEDIHKRPLTAFMQSIGRQLGLIL